MRIAVTTVMLNEPPEFIERWVKSAMDAFDLVLVDTGSTNDAVECARDLGVCVYEISVRPWRFDTARNAGLALLDPDTDLVLKLDVDEVLMPGWRDSLESAPAGQRYSYTYAWSPDLTFRADHTHSRFGWQWRHPCHEHLVWQGPGPEPDTVPTDMRIVHLPDPAKSRGQYLPLLARAVREDPADDRMAHYYARELYFQGDWTAARVEFTRHLSLPGATWAPERAQSYRYLAKMDDYPERWLLRAAGEDGSRREVWVDLAELWVERGEPGIAAGFARRALLITEMDLNYMTEAPAWDDERLRQIAEAG